MKGKQDFSHRVWSWKTIPSIISAVGCILTAVMDIMKSNLVQLVENQLKIRFPVVTDFEEIID